MSLLPKNKKATVGIGVAAAAAAAIALGGGTYAAFSDTETGPGGTLAAGTLDLEVGATPTTPTPLFTAKNVVPGFQSETYELTYHNAGSIDGKLSLALGVKGSENKCTPPEEKVDKSCDGAGELGEKLIVKVTGPNLEFSGNLNSLAGGPNPYGIVPAEKSAVYKISYSLPATVGNEVQSDEVTVTTSATLDQVTP